ncbi:MAG TPA: hypothetical protein VFU20_04065 [Sphingomicrobium sp.]|nr:hypothetical protein [Sphingomicrobium sp.]
MAHDREYFRRRAAEARSASLRTDDGEGIEVAGHLALAYAALARRRGAPARPDAPDAVDHADASVADAVPLMLGD